MTPVLYAGSHLPESLLGHLVQLLSAQAQIVTLIRSEHLLEDVLVVGRALLSLRAVDKPLDLTVGKKQSSTSNKSDSGISVHIYCPSSRQMGRF